MFRSPLAGFVARCVWLLVCGFSFSASGLFGQRPLEAQDQSAPQASVASPELLKSELLAIWDSDKLNQIVNAELEEFLQGSPLPFENFKGRFASPRHRVQLHRLTFRSVVPELGNRAIESTGLVAIPETTETELPVLAYQHGTVFEKDSVPSRPDQSLETKLLLTQFASQGYIVIAADYFGLGDSDLPNSYFQRASTEQACLDFRAAAL